MVTTPKWLLRSTPAPLAKQSGLSAHSCAMAVLTSTYVWFEEVFEVQFIVGTIRRCESLKSREVNKNENVNDRKYTTRASAARNAVVLDV